MKHRYMIWILTAALILSAFALAGCGDTSDKSADTKTEKQEKKDDSDQKAETQEPAPEPEPEPEPEPVKEPETKTMYTVTDLAFRAEASQTSDKIGAVPINQKVKVYDTSKEYYKIEYKGKKGYVLGNCLTESKAEAEQAAKDAAAAAAAKQQAAPQNNGGGGSNGGGSQKQCLDGGLIN